MASVIRFMLIMLSVTLVTVSIAGFLLSFCNEKPCFPGHNTISGVDTIYFLATTGTTVGYGDLTPNSTVIKVFSALMALAVILVIDPVLSHFTQHFLRHQYFAHPCKKIIMGAACLILPILLLMTLMYEREKYGAGEALYAAIITFSTVGLGDDSFQTTRGRIGATILIVLGRLCLYVLSDLVDYVFFGGGNAGPTPTGPSLPPSSAAVGPPPEGTLAPSSAHDSPPSEQSLAPSSAHDSPPSEQSLGPSSDAPSNSTQPHQFVGKMLFQAMTTD